MGAEMMIEQRVQWALNIKFVIVFSHHLSPVTKSVVARTCISPFVSP